jgi:hypothetical protein
MQDDDAGQTKQFLNFARAHWGLVRLSRVVMSRVVSSSVPRRRPASSSPRRRPASSVPRRPSRVVLSRVVPPLRRPVFAHRVSYFCGILKHPLLSSRTRNRFQEY